MYTSSSSVRLEACRQLRIDSTSILLPLFPNNNSTVGNAPDYDSVSVCIAYFKLRSQTMQKLTRDHPLIQEQLKQLEQDYQAKKLEIIMKAKEELIAEREKETLRYFGITAHADRTRRDRV